jgi:hypothetical protein
MIHITLNEKRFKDTVTSLARIGRKKKVKNMKRKKTCLDNPQSAGASN